MKRVLVTGGGGFCGKYLCRFLERRGYEVIAPRRRELDITGQPQVERFLKKIKPHFICHLGAQSNARLSWSEPDLTYQINIWGTLNIARAVLRYLPKARLLYTSSVHVYGRALQNSKAVREPSFLWPENPYAVSKALSEMACLDLHRRAGLDIVIARANNYFGVGQSPAFVFSDWCRQIARAEKELQPPVIEVGNLALKRDFLPVEDGIAAYELLLRKGRSGHLYNIGSGRSRSLKYYLQYLLSQARIPIKVRAVKSRFRPDDTPVVQVNENKLRALGWKPRRDVKQTLNAMLAEWRVKI